VVNVASARATLEISQKKNKEALETVRRTMAKVRATLPPDDPIYGGAVGWMGAMCLNAGDLDCAVQAGEQGVAARTALLGPRHPSTAIAVLNLCASELETARWASGAKHCESAYQLLGATYSRSGIIYGIAAGNYGQALQDLGRFGEARPLIEEAAAVLGKVGPRNPNRCDQLESLVELDLEQRRPDLLARDVHALLACRPPPVVTEREGARALASEAALELAQGKGRAALKKLEAVVAASHPGLRSSERFEAGLYRFLLAEALERQQPGSSRARRLAAEARERFDGLGRTFWSDEVARWLASLRPAAEP
jgi:tetratricopeptide (TPR) repeat protein